MRVLLPGKHLPVVLGLSINQCSNVLVPGERAVFTSLLFSKRVLHGSLLTGLLGCKEMRRFHILGCLDQGLAILLLTL
jgi:hypothetical protein